jgi:hypothetical protein
MRDPFADFEAVLIFNNKRPDPALDFAAMRLDEYILTRDPDLIVDLAGKRSARFLVKRLGWRQAGALSSMSKGHIQDCALFLAACHQVTLASGQILIPTLPPPDSTGVQTAPESWLEEIIVKQKFGRHAVYEIARVIRDFADLTEDGPRVFTFPVG